MHEALPTRTRRFARPARRRGGSAWVGLLTFVFGVLMIVIAFKLAYDLFQVPPEVRLKIEPDEPIQLSQAASTFMEVLVRILMLVVMAGFGSMVANRGVKLYAAKNAAHKPATSGAPDGTSSTTDSSESPRS